MCGDKAGRVSPARWTISHYYDPRARSAAGRQRDEKPGWVAVKEKQKPGKQSTLRSLVTEDGKAEVARGSIRNPTSSIQLPTSNLKAKAGPSAVDTESSENALQIKGIS